MTERYLIHVDDGGPLEKPYQYLGPVYIRPSSFETAVTFIKKNFSISTIYVNVASLSIKDAASLLDSGASRVVISRSQLEEFLRGGLHHAVERFIVACEGSYSDILEGAKAVAAVSSNLGIYISGVESTKRLSEVKSSSGLSKVYVSLKNCAETLVREAIWAGLVPVIPNFTTFGPFGNGPSNPFAISPDALVLAALKSDRQDGLYPTVVADERGISLGLVYSSAESIRESFKTGRGVYHSRQRGLWYKGETSGDIQELVKIVIDCDGDTLLFTVRQKGDGEPNAPTLPCVNTS